MNRAERRRQNREVEKDPTIVMKQSDIKKIKLDATRDALNLLFAIPVFIVHDEFGKFIKLEVDGKCREERFLERCLELYDCFEKGYVTIKELTDTMEQETGYKFNL